MHRWNQDQVRYVTSGLERFLRDADGETTGLMLTNGMEVHLPPYLSARIVATVRIGDRITVYGTHGQASTLMRAVAVVSPEGDCILDDEKGADGAQYLSSSRSRPAIPYLLWRADGLESST
jgi:hypothetical protein